MKRNKTLKCMMIALDNREKNWNYINKKETN